MSQRYATDLKLVIDSNQYTNAQDDTTYEIMHMNRVVATVSLSGRADIHDLQFMPYDLYLESDDGNDLDTMVNNITNFYYWCASRVLTLDRQYAKEILNSIGVSQATTDKERAKISLSYHCVSLTDVYWVREKREDISFEQINLYDNSLNAALVEISLKGKQMTATNHELAQDLSTKGCFPKAWIRDQQGFKLLKDGGEKTVQNELLASKICRCFDFEQVFYNEYTYDGQMVTESKIVTSKERSIVSKMAYEIYTDNHDMDVLDEIIKLDAVSYYGMNILDYLIGNTDRHPENWGVWVDNRTNTPISLYPLMDFNKSFLSYDSLDGANCQTVLPRKMTQREAAIEAVKKIGLRQKHEMDMAEFKGMVKEADMFISRLNELRKYA